MKIEWEEIPEPRDGKPYRVRFEPKGIDMTGNFAVQEIEELIGKKIEIMYIGEHIRTRYVYGKHMPTPVKYMIIAFEPFVYSFIWLGGP